MRTRLWLAPLFVVAATTACDRSTSGRIAPAASSAPTPTTPPTSSASADSSAPDDAGDAAPTEGLGNPPRLADADIATLESGLKCKPGSPPKVDGPCKVLVAMEKCDEWEGAAPSGDARWIGHAWQTTGAASTARVALLRVRAIHQSEVKPWQLAAKIAIATLGKDAGAAFVQADAAIAALAHHAAPAKKNAAVDLLKQKSDWTDEAPAAKTMGTMVETFSDRPTYVCQGPDKRLELVQQGSADIGVKSDGLYAELWPVGP